MSNYLDLLNEQQREAVQYVSGPQLVIAGAGAGKTRVLTYKIVHLLSLGYEPYRIIALTFTNKAAREMKQRVADVLGDKVARRLWMGTFHSVFLRILRSHHELIGFKQNFTIYDTSDSRSVIKGIIKDMQLDEKQYKPATIHSIISNAKNALVLPQQYLKDRDYAQVDKNARRPMTGVIYQRYMERCRLAEAMDFDDILLYMNILLRDNPDICRHYQQFFRYILVDEYQDTNFAQHMIITQLAGQEQNLCVVGDDAQSIYSFRGANISNILNLQRFYPTMQIFKLERNYRSTKNIIEAANSLIAANKQQIPKKIFSENEEGSRIELIECYSDMEESTVVATKISQSKLVDHDSLDEYAVLYRTNAQSRLLEEALRKRSIPYRIYGGLSFYQRKEIKDALAYFRLTTNLDDDEALKRIINYPARGIGDTTLKKVQSAAIRDAVSMWAVVSNPEAHSLDVNGGTKRKLQAFADMMAEFTTDMERGSSAYDLARLIYNRTGLLAVLAHDDTPESISQKENLEELLRNIKDFTDERVQTGDETSGLSLQDFLSEVSLATDQDEKEDEDKPKVTLMTVHAAKGLEFKHIYVVGVEEGLFPSSMAMDTMREVEEERRLLYVAITRAKSFCTLTHCRTRYRNGKEEWPHPSRFLKDISPKYLSRNTSRSMDEPTGKFGNVGFNPQPTRNRPWLTRQDEPKVDSGIRTNSRRRLTGGSTSAASGEKVQSVVLDDGRMVSVGTIIEHKLFGYGSVVGIEKMPDNIMLDVQFKTVGRKRLICRFAKFTIVNN